MSVRRVYLLAFSLALAAAAERTSFQVNPLSSANPPELARAATRFVGLNQLRITILAPRVAGRSDIAFSVGQCVLGNLSEFIVDDGDNAGDSHGRECYDVAAIDYTWSVLAHCNLSVLHGDGFDEYFVPLTSQYSEIVGGANGQQTLGDLDAVAPYDDSVTVTADPDPLSEHTIGNILYQTWSIVIVPPASATRTPMLKPRKSCTVLRTSETTSTILL
eukprot:m51a1_g3756 hypothetical protein (218) ;mRNA; r:80914-83018